MRRSSLVVLFALSVFTAIVIAAHGYFATRLVLDTALPRPWSTLATCAIALGGSLIFAHPLAERAIGPGIGRVLGWPGYFWMGACFYLLLALWGSDLLLFASGLDGMSVPIARTRALVVVAFVAVVVLLGAWSALRPPPIKRVELPIAGLPREFEGYRIVQISDIHVGSLLRTRFTELLVERCNSLQPDIVAITGDLVDGSVHHYGQHVNPFARLSARDGVYFVTGNHDHFSGAERWVSKLQELGIVVLRNRRVALERSGARIELAGVDDISSRRTESSGGHDLPRALSGWDRAVPLVLLAHHPRTFDEARTHGVHLQLSGHTHGGQLWPFGYMVRLQTPYVAGIYRHENSVLYVSRGTGFWGPPMRLGAPAEITELILRAV
jgi:uncharacterized protein